MLLKLRGHLTYANVTATLALFFAMAGAGAYAANEWTGANIVDGSLTGQDVFNNTIAGADITNGSLTGADVFDNTIGSADITNGSLNDEDVGQATLINFEAFIGIVNANSCVARAMTGVSAQGDHLLLTPNVDLNESNPNLVYEAEYAADGSVEIHVCNPTGTGFNAGNTSFNLLVFDAQ
jgi:hypothetical protein